MTINLSILLVCCLCPSSPARHTHAPTWCLNDILSDATPNLDNPGFIQLGYPVCQMTTNLRQLSF
jgi:hypothetical protein